MKHDPPKQGLPVVYAPPFLTAQLRRVVITEDMTLLEIVKSFGDLPPRFLQHGTITINGHEIKRELWHVVRPKKPTEERPVAVTLHYTPRGGRGGGGGGSTLKSVIGIVGALALAIVTAGIASGLFFAETAAYLGAAVGFNGSALLAGAVGIAGALALSALTAPPTTGPAGQGSISGGIDDTNTDSKEAAGSNSNVLTPGGSIPRVVGTRKVFPPLACYPLVSLEGEDEYVEAIYCLNGPHRLSDIRIDNASVTDVQDVEIETREGWEDDLLLSKFSRQGRMTTPNIELSVHKVINTAQQQLQTPVDPRKSCPVWHGMMTRTAPDEIWIHMLFPGGISSAGGSTQLGIPYRLRMRRIGTTDWINFPEFHIADATISQRRKAILIKWKSAEPVSAVPSSNGFVFAACTIDQTATDPDIVHADSAWAAHSFFGSGSTHLFTGNETTTSVRNMNLFDNRVEFYLDEATFPKGMYEIQLKRGSVYSRSSFTQSTYNYASLNINFFTWFISGGVVFAAGDRTNVADKCGVTRVISVWNQYPIQDTGFALIGIRARNRSIQNLSCDASGYVKDYNSSTGLWDTWTTTSNPAPHYRDALVGQLNLDPLPLELCGDTDLIAWRTLCNSFGWVCDAIVDDQRLQDHLQLLASCGYAKPYQSDIYTVTVDSDRSADTPQAVFSRMNSSGFRYEKAFARVPAGLIVSYRDNAQDDDRAQVVVYQSDPDIPEDATLLESISYDGLTTEAAVRARAKFDLDQANLRSTFYFLDTDIEALPVRRGDLVAVQHDVIDLYGADARIKSITRAGSPDVITGFVLDSEVPIVNEVDMLSVADMLAVPDMLLVGITTGIAIRHYGNGVVTTHQLSTATSSTATITLTTPLVDDGTIKGFNDTNSEYGCLITVGRLGTEYLRMLVMAIAATREMKCSLVLVDEAPTLVRFDDRTVLLLHFDGATGSTVQFDASQKQHGPLTFNNGAVISTTQSKFGGSSLLLAASSPDKDNCTLPYSSDWEFGAGDFTVDWWERRAVSGTPSGQPILSRDETTLFTPFIFGYDNGGNNRVFWITSADGSWDIANGRSLGTISVGVWTHCAVSRQGNNFFAFKDGVLTDSFTSSLSIRANTNPLSIGRTQTNSYYNGFIDELRITKGLARWTAAFTPPTAPYR